MTQFLVKFTVCEQVTPDKWEMTPKERLFTEDHKLSDIKAWIVENGGYITENFYKRILEVKLSEPQKF